MSAPPASVVHAVLVAYHPDPARLATALESLVPQVSACSVVNNGPAGLTLSNPGIEVLQQDGNVGLAAAQNAGIAWARANGATHVLILDHDSVPAPNMVATLLAALERLSQRTKVAAVGPRYRDPREQRDAPFIKIAFPMSRKLRCDAESPDIEADFLISSGSLIPLSVLDDVGDMDEGIFIDNVDMEWSFRVRAKGYRLYGVCAATMEHSLGDAREPVFAGAARVVRHGPVRLYFIMRNRVALYRRPYTPRVWIAQDVPRVFVKFAIFAILAGPRLRNVRYMLRGLHDGIRGRSGPCPLEAAA